MFTTQTVRMAPTVAVTMDEMSSAPSTGFVPSRCPGQEASDQGTHDAEQDMPDDAQTLVPADEEAGQVAGDRAEHDPRKNAH